MQSASSRIQLLRNHLSTPKQQTPVFSSLDFCFFDDLLTTEEVQFRREVREFAEKEISPVINEYYEQAKFPQPLFEKIGEKGWLQGLLAKPEGAGKGATSIGLLLLEIARVDGSMATTLFVHLGVLLYNIQAFCSEEQKKKLIPDMVKLKKYCGWGLTEPNVGSDAGSLETRVKKVPGGYEINGAKRWPGNSDKDMLIVWARREDTKKVEGFIVPVTLPGVKVEIIKHKLSMRCVQNSHITMDKVFVPEENKLPKADKGFLSISQELAHSRVIASWIAVGMAVGVYDNTIKYLNSRMQFGVKISSFQLTQEKLARMMGHIQAMALLAWRVTRLDEQKKMTSGMSSMAKAWTTNLCREVAKLGREMLGGNGIIADNYVMKALVDIEGLYTYEGTYDVNMLVLGRELTGINAFK